MTYFGYKNDRRFDTQYHYSSKTHTQCSVKGTFASYFNQKANTKDYFTCDKNELLFSGKNVLFAILSFLFFSFIHSFFHSPCTFYISNASLVLFLRSFFTLYHVMQSKRCNSLTQNQILGFSFLPTQLLFESSFSHFKVNLICNLLYLSPWFLQIFAFVLFLLVIVVNGTHHHHGRHWSIDHHHHSKHGHGGGHSKYSWWEPKHHGHHG